MGNGMNKVIPGLYIGNFRDAKDTQQISDNSITHIIAIHDNAKPSLENIEYKCIDIGDSPGQNIAEHFFDCIEFIHNARKNGGNVLVHCIAGVSRSCTICAAYLVVITKISWSDAILAIRYSRSVVNPNYGFQKQLQTFEKLDAEKEKGTSQDVDVKNQIRQKLMGNFGEFDMADTDHVKQALENIDPNTQASRIFDENTILGTTPTFGNYERKKREGAGGKNPPS